MTREELDALEADIRKMREVAFANKERSAEFNKAWQRRHNRTFIQACKRTWRRHKLQAHGDRYQKAVNRWLAEK